MALIPYNTVVTTPAASKDLTDLATVKLELDIAGSTHNDYLTLLIQQASSKAVELSGREFAAETVRDSFRVNGDSDHALQLSRRPIKSVTSVTEDGTVLVPADYEIIALGGRLERVDSGSELQAWGGGKIVVVYVAGYTLLTEESHALERIVINEIKRSWFIQQHAATHGALVKSETVFGVASWTYAVNGGSGSSSGGSSDKDPMLAELEAQRFVDVPAL